MAASDVSILAAGAEALPLTYTIPPTQAFQVKAASASFDGTGASGTFTPVLTIRNDAGLVVARCLDASQTTAAGGSVEPSWFPHVAHRSSAATGGLPVASIRQLGGSPTTITSTVLPQYTSLQGGVNAVFATTDPSVFDNSSTTLFTGSPLFGIGVLAVGTYRYDWNMICQGNGSAGQKLTAYWSSSGTALLSELQQGRVQLTMNDTWDANVTNHLFWTEWQSFVNPGDVPGVAVPYGIKQGGTSPVVVYELIVTQISPTPLADL